MTQPDLVTDAVTNEPPRPSSVETRLTTVETYLEDVLDHIYGKNVRPQLIVRDPDERAAAVKPSNQDD